MCYLKHTCGFRFGGIYSATRDRKLMSLTETNTQTTASFHRGSASVAISVDGHTIAAIEGELLVEAILREKEIPHICYHSPLMGPIQTCDTCLVEVDGKLVRSCGTKVTSGMQV